MCYNARYLLLSAKRRAERKQNFENLEYYKQKLKEFDEAFGEDLYYADGFRHPKIPVYTNAEPNVPNVANWGLIPHWTKTLKDGQKFWNNTLNAKSETIFTKPSFRDAAKFKRCLIPVAGFFEYHHQAGKTYPFYITSVNDEPLNLAGLWSEWTDKETGEVWNTCAIVTTKANSMMAKIHNNPKLPEPRMPVILHEEIEEQWLNEINPNSALDIEELKQLCIPFPDDALKAHTVRQLKGKNGVGNVPQSSDEFIYEDLELEV